MGMVGGMIKITMRLLSKGPDKEMMLRVVTET